MQNILLYRLQNRSKQEQGVCLPHRIDFALDFFCFVFVLPFVSPPAYLLVRRWGGSCSGSSYPDYLIYAYMITLIRLRSYDYARTIVRLRIRLLRMLHVCPGRPKRRPMYVLFG